MPNVLLCNLSSLGMRYVPGREEPCADCKRSVYVSDSSRSLIAEHAALIVCTECGLARAEQERAIETVVGDEQMEELRLYSGASRDEVVRFLASLLTRRRS